MTTVGGSRESDPGESANAVPDYPDHSDKVTPDWDIDPVNADWRGEQGQVEPYLGQATQAGETGDPELATSQDNVYAPADEPLGLVPAAEAEGESISTAAFTAFLQQMDDRFGSVHETLDATVTSLEQNLEKSLALLRTKEEESRLEVSRDLLRPLAQRFAMLVDRIELAIARRAEDPCDPWLLSQTAVDEALEILDEFGIEDIDAEPGSEVDRAWHRVVKMANEKTDSTDSSRILERLRHGLVVDGHVVRPAEVVAEWVPSRRLDDEESMTDW